MITRDSVVSLSKSLFAILKVENCFIKTEFHERHEKQLYRNMLQFNNLNRILEIGEHHLENYLKWNNQTVPNMPITKYNYFIELITLLCNHGLASYELLKRFFLETMDLDKLTKISGQQIRLDSTWGQLSTAISKLPNVSEQITTELFDIAFRNTLAHDSWYLHEGSMR
ncbi:MAG: hypothetical protein ACREBJ_09020, partial [Nitrosotalea sp.]